MPDLRGTKALVGRYHELGGSRHMNISFPDRGRAVAADASSLAADIVLPAGEGVRDLRKAARDVADQAFARAALYDEDGAYPAADVAALAERGLLTAALPRALGGDGIGPLALSELLREIGAGSLPLGRLFEGHVNALGLVLRYGDDEQARLVADEAHAGKLFGVWNTDDKEGLRLLADRGRRRLQGQKILASGAGFIERPLVTATETGRRLMVIPYLQPGQRADLSSWTAHGMRARRPERSISRASRSRRSKLSAATATTSVSPPFPAAHAVSSPCIWTAWRSCSTCCASTCAAPAAAETRIRRRDSARLRSRPRNVAALGGARRGDRGRGAGGEIGRADCQEPSWLENIEFRIKKAIKCENID